MTGGSGAAAGTAPERPPPPFRIVETRRPFSGKVVTVRTDRIADPDGRTGEREVVEHNGAVAALVVDEDGQVVLVDQWRHAVGARVLEVAAGKYDVDGEAVEDALRRELAEELGVEGGTLTFLASFYTTPGWSDEVLDLYLAEGVTPIQGDAPAADWEEQGIEVVRLPFAEAVRRAAGPPGDAKTLVALGLYGLKLAGTWSPDPSGRPPPDAPARRAAARPA
jgi:8-oxo-dGTP pyrophosphatase MutT (NUDIX family)